MKLRSLLLAGLPVLLLALLVCAPAASLYGWLRPGDQPSAIELFGLEGNLSAGRVAGVVVNGRTVLADLDWRLRPQQALLGRLGLSLKATKDPTLLDGALSISPLGTLRLQDFRANAGLRPLMAGLGYPFLPVDGQVGLEFDHLTAAKRQLRDAEGSVQLLGLAWALGANPTPLGDFRADVTTADGVIVAKLSSVSGPLDLDGEARLLADQTWEFQARLKAKPGAPPMLQNMLQQLGAPGTQGYYQLRRQGALPGAQPAPP